MGARADKGRALNRYLTGTTGIPMLSWNGHTIDAPYPYEFDVTTSRSLENWYTELRKEPTDRLRFCIRYDNSLPSLEQAWVGMHLSTFTTLLTSHFDTIRTRFDKE